MSTLRIRTQGYLFTLPTRFAPNHVLSEAEAHALNGLFAENVRNNISDWVRSATAGLSPGELLSEESLAQLQSRISAYAENYEFKINPSPKNAMSPIELELERLARAKAQEGEDIAELLLDPTLMAQARANVQARRKSANQALSRLLQSQS